MSTNATMETNLNELSGQDESKLMSVFNFLSQHKEGSVNVYENRDYTQSPLCSIVSVKQGSTYNIRQYTYTTPAHIECLIRTVCNDNKPLGISMNKIPTPMAIIVPHGYVSGI